MGKQSVKVARPTKPLNVDNICEITKKSKPFVIKILRELKKAQLLNKDKDGYKLSPSLIQKGGARK